MRTLFWSEWIWDAIARELVTIDEALELLTLQMLYRRTGLYLLPPS